MSPEERDELMQFILESQSNAARERRDAAKERREMAQDHREFRKELKETRADIKALAALSRDLLKVEQIHSRRLDRLEGLTS